MLGKSCTSAPPNGLAYFSQVPDLVQNKKAEVLLQGKTSAFFIWPAAVSNHVNYATFSKITKSCQKSPKTDKNPQKSPNN